MNEKIIFVRTPRGEDEIHSGTAHLSKDIKRALLMVDGVASVARIIKRSSPSLRGMLEDMLTDLHKGGYIEDKAKIVTKRVSFSEIQPDESGELDFTTVPALTTQWKAQALKSVPIEAAHMSAKQALECLSEESERTTSTVADWGVASVAIQPIREKIVEYERESGKISPDMIALNVKNAAMEARVFSELDTLNKKEAASDQAGGNPATERRNVSAAVQGCDSRGANKGVPLIERRVITVAVVFFDIVGYTKQSDSMQIIVKQKFNELLMRSLDRLAPEEWIILDTGDGAAIGFLHYPTEAMSVAMRFCAELLAGGQMDGLGVRIGVNLGPVSLVRDINGQINMLGDGINSAQRVMSFAGENQIYVSRAYVDFVSSLGYEYGKLFRYHGELQDKHGREHQVYELSVVDMPPDDSASILPGNADAFNFDAFNLELSRLPEPVKLPEPLVTPRSKDDAGAKWLAIVESYVPESLPEIPPETLSATPLETSPETEPEIPPVTIVLAKVPAESSRLPETSPEPAVRTEVTVEVVPRAVMPVEKKSLAASVVPADNKKINARAIVKVTHYTQPWGKWATGVLILLMLMLFLVPFVWPLQNYVAGIEQHLSEKLHQPVHIGHLAGRILPVPELTLSDLSIGQAGQIQIPRVQMNFAITALFRQIKSIDSVELDEIQIQGAGLPEVSAWLQQLAGDPSYPIRRIVVAHAQLDEDGVLFSAVEGALDFDSSGKFINANFDANEHKLVLQIHAMPADKLQLTIALHDSVLPALPDLIFDSFHAQGELNRSELRLNSLEGVVRGNILTGNARINWRRGWHVQGELAAKAMPLQHVNKLLAGDAEVSASFQMQAASLAKLADTATVRGMFSAQKGLINGMDIVETARLYSQKNLPGGRTHFDEMSGHFSYANGNYLFDQLKLNGNMMKAAGRLSITGSTLSGVISTDLAMRAGSVVLQISGTTASPSLQLAP